MPFLVPSSPTNHNHRKRTSTSTYDTPPLKVVDPSRFYGELTYAPPHQQQHLVLSGGKDDLGALAMLEDNVKLKSLKTSPGPTQLHKHNFFSSAPRKEKSGYAFYSSFLGYILIRRNQLRD